MSFATAYASAKYRTVHSNSALHFYIDDIEMLDYPHFLQRATESQIGNCHISAHFHVFVF